MTDSNWAEKNRAHFNGVASTYQSRFSKTILQLIEEVQNRRDWIGGPWLEDSSSSSDGEGNASSKNEGDGRVVRLLDYACGTGMISRALAPYVSQCVGVDVSESMVNEYNTMAQNQGILPEEMHAVVGNLIDSHPSPPSSPLGEFDVAAVGMGWHHFSDPGLAAKRLAEKLKVGGVFFIVDFLPHGGVDGHSHNHGHGHDHRHSHDHGHGSKDTPAEKGKGKEVGDAAHTVTHLGFSESDIRKTFEEAGLGGDFAHVALGDGVVFTHEGRELKRSVFIARGTKL